MEESSGETEVLEKEFLTSIGMEKQLPNLITSGPSEDIEFLDEQIGDDLNNTAKISKIETSAQDIKKLYTRSNSQSQFSFLRRQFPIQEPFLLQLTWCFPLNSQCLSPVVDHSPDPLTYCG